MQCLLLTTDNRSVEDFNESFVAAWKTTHNYKQLQSENEALSSIPVGYVYTRLSIMSMHHVLHKYVSEVLISHCHTWIIAYTTYLICVSDSTIALLAIVDI